MPAFVSLTVEQVLLIHAEVVAQTGGAHGVRDKGAVESAVSQPHMSFGEADLYPTLADKSAALGFSLVSNHPFVDGNKRIGWVALKAFLNLNGMTIEVAADEAERTILRLAAGELSREEWTTWVQKHIVPFES
jgi:death-on-curing protein